MIKKDPTNIQQFHKPLFFSESARVGFRHLLRNLKIPSDQFILLPSYIGLSVREGSGVLDPIEDCNICYDFYRVDSNLSANLDDLKKKLSSIKAFAVFVIHYFGFMQSDILMIKEICKENQILLIEDCAHCLPSCHDGSKLGMVGDFSLFSIHKFFPTKAGGILQVNNNAYSFQDLPEEEKISRQDLETFTCSDLLAIAKQRVANYNALLKLLLPYEEKIEIPFSQIPDGIVPMNFPVLLKSHDRHEIYKKLIDEGVEAISLYYQLIEQIREDQYPLSHAVSNKILNLPIHQDVTKEDVQVIADKLLKVLC